jgi:hypothetical protein
LRDRRFAAISVGRAVAAARQFGTKLDAALDVAPPTVVRLVTR